LKVEKENKMFGSYITRSYLQSLKFKPFDDAMYDGFAGVRSPVPFYADDGDEYLIILDGNYVEMYDAEGELLESCDDISELPY
jgi:hypothetical protein